MKIIIFKTISKFAQTQRRIVIWYDLYERPQGFSFYKLLFYFPNIYIFNFFFLVCKNNKNLSIW